MTPKMNSLFAGLFRAPQSAEAEKEYQVALEEAAREVRKWEEAADEADPSKALRVVSMPDGSLRKELVGVNSVAFVAWRKSQEAGRWTH